MNVSSRANSRAESSISDVAAPDLARGRIEAQIAGLQDRRALDRTAPDERAQARRQLRERERLGQVVVRAAVEPAHPVLDRVASGQHQHRHPDAVGAQPPAGREPVEPGHHHVEHDRVVVGRARRMRSASSPSPARSTTRPSKRRPRRIAAAIRTSSSTTRTLTPPSSRSAEKRLRETSASQAGISGERHARPVLRKRRSVRLAVAALGGARGKGRFGRGRRGRRMPVAVVKARKRRPVRLGASGRSWIRTRDLFLIREAL